MNKTPILMAAVLAVATVLATGLTILPDSVQDAQANPCGSIVNTPSQSGSGGGGNLEVECTIIGNNDFDE